MRGAQENIFYSLWAQPKSSFPPQLLHSLSKHKDTSKPRLLPPTQCMAVDKRQNRGRVS